MGYSEEPMIYLNYAATSGKKPKQVADAVKDAILNMGNAGRGVSGRSLEAGRTVLLLREKVAEFFGFSHPERVVFTSNVTQALNMVIFGLLSPGDHVITTDLEHNAVLRPLHQLQTTGVIEVDYLRADSRGNVNPNELKGMIRANTKLIISTHASNVTGSLVDIASIGEIARSHGIIFCADVAQTAGVYEIDMEKQKIDILCFTGHKSLMGPTGTGGCLISEDVDIRPLLHGGTGIRSKDPFQPNVYPEHLEAGTLNTHGLAGLGAALDYLKATGLSNILEHETRLRTHFLDGISSIPGIRIYGMLTREYAPIVLLNMDGISSDELADVLAQEFRIEVRAGLHCAPRIHKALGTDTTGAVRFSFGYFTTIEEVDAAIHALRSISKQLQEECESFETEGE